MTDPDPDPDPATAPAKTSGWYVDVPLLGPVGWPPTGTLAFAVVLGGLAATEVIAWPVAVIVGVGHILARDHDHRLIREIGEGLQVAD
ncbi:hypothetical protein ACFPK1_32620 [Actinomycetospora rhizophila]|uniref:Uncharacterized protein n=1 Tax=Actinomycetospora rhizophila TaxID=1416876 RepID=A0ABV9ZNJ0_9PSEU